MTGATQGTVAAVTVEHREGVAVVTLDNQRRGNALTPGMTSDLMRIWPELEADPEVRVIVVTGAGERAFCAGNDLSETPPEPEEDPAWNFAGLAELATVTKPVVCAINGYAVGGGLEIALASDIRICTATTTFSFPEPKVGVIASVGGTQRLPRVVGLGRAMHMLLTAATVDAATALSWGLVTGVSDGPVLDDALTLARTVVGLGPRAIRATKNCVNRAFDLPLPEGRALERQFSGVLRYADERLEGLAAFREKRAPAFAPTGPDDPELALLSAPTTEGTAR